MVPTEVLARQHFESMNELFTGLGLSARPVLLTGSMAAKEKRLAYETIANHEADIYCRDTCPDTGESDL